MSCPNCALAQAGFLGSYGLTFFVCGLIALVTIAAIVWAMRSGQLEDVEGVKYRMLERELADEDKKHGSWLLEVEDSITKDTDPDSGGFAPAASK